MYTSFSVVPPLSHALYFLLCLLQKVPFLSDDLELECEGKDKYKCGSNVFWKW